MNIFDRFLNRKKKSFKLSTSTRTTSNTINNIENNMKKTFSNLDNSTLEMFEAIKKYNNVKSELIQRGLCLENSLSFGEALSIIDYFFKGTIDVLPSGTIIPVKTEFVINGVKQTLLLGKELMCVGQFANQSATKLKRGVKIQDKVAVFINSSKVTDYTNFTNNIRINIDTSTDYIINLLSEEFLKDKWSKCRFSIIELTFSDWKESISCIKRIENISDSEQLLKHLPVLEKEILKSVTLFLDTKAEHLSSGNLSNQYQLSETPRKENIDTKEQENIDTKEQENINDSTKT